MLKAKVKVKVRSLLTFSGNRFFNRLTRQSRIESFRNRAVSHRKDWRNFLIQKSGKVPLLGRRNLIYSLTSALTLRTPSQRPIGDLAVWHLLIPSAHHPIERDVASNQQRAPNQQRHKHCLLALTWHWPQIPGPAQRLWAIGSGARKDLETSISSQHRQTHLPQRRRPRTDESPHHLPFRIRRSKHPRQIPVFVQFFVDWCAR